MEEYNRWDDPGMITVILATEEDKRELKRQREITLKNLRKEFEDDNDKQRKD